MQQMALFDYDQLGTEDRIVVQQRTGEIKELVRTTAENVVRIGEKLVEVRSRLDNGRFTAWIKAEFDWSRRTAYNFISVFEQFGSRANFAQLDIATSALYLLASPSTPPEARAEALELAESGERVTHSAAKALVEERKSPPLRPTPDADPDLGPPPPRPPQTPPPPPRLRPDQEPRPAGQTLEQTAAPDTRYSIFECPACGEKKIKRDRGSYACHGCQASWDGGKAFFDHVNERDADGQPADDGLPDWVVKPEGLEPDAPSARSELCPACGDEAFFSDGGWDCDGCERRCSKLEAMYNHGVDFYCRACHLATHEQGPPVLSETCPACGDEAFFPDTGWKCNSCGRRCSRLEGQYFHAFDAYCRACHLATHKQGPPLPDADLVAAHDVIRQMVDTLDGIQEGDSLYKIWDAVNEAKSAGRVALGLEAA